MNHTPSRGFTLLIAVIVASVALSIGIALLDISYKQVILAGTAKQSVTAFYNADAILECALFYDQRNDAFSYASANPSITCNSLSVQNYVTNVANGVRTTTFTVPCASSGTQGTVTVTKTSAAVTTIYANGYNTCDTSAARRIERGLKITY